MKKLFLDEMYNGYKDYFQLLGAEVETAAEAKLNGSPDIEVIKYVKENNLLLITQDTGAYQMAQLIGVDAMLISAPFIAKAIYDSLERSVKDV